MNWLGLGTVLLGFAAYFLAQQWARKPMSKATALLIGFGTAVLAIPACVYDLYYFKLLGEPIWLYRMRVVPGSELLGAAAGFLAGWTRVRWAPSLKLSPLGKRFLLPVVLGFTLALPYLKPVLRPLSLATLREEWRGAVCMQSTLSTCGPASAATIARRLGVQVSERELAREAFTCRSGTENWYLARTLRRRGLQTSFVLSDPLNVPLPAIAGVRLKSYGNSGHFIALLERRANEFVLADPMEGLSTSTLADLQSSFEFTGFFLLIRPDARGDQRP